MARLDDRERLGRLGASLVLRLVAILRIRLVAIDNLAAVGLVSVTAVLGLIGWWGFLFVPSIAMLGLAGARHNPT